MSTRSRIAVQGYDGGYKSIYCHFDGYIDGVGEMLFKNYRNMEKLQKLMALGDISSLGKEPVSVERFSKEDDETNDKCRAYSSRGEECPAIESNNVFDVVDIATNQGCEYVYVYQKGFDGIYNWEFMEIGCFRSLANELRNK